MRRSKTSSPQKLYGLLAKFEDSDSLIAAARQTYDSGYRQFDAYSPYPIEALPHAMRLKSSPMPFVVLAGGLLGAVGGFFMQVFATGVDYPLNIGGRPLISWPAYIPITFELTILLGATIGVLGLFFFTRFPQPYHPVFTSEDFNQHSSECFYLGIEASDPKFDREGTRRFLEGFHPSLVSEIEG